MTYLDVSKALMPRISSMSVLKICLTVAAETDCGRHRVRLTIADFAELTGMAKQTILDGLASALADGWLEREAAGNSFWYVFSTRNLDQSQTETRPKRYEIQTETVRNSDQTSSEIQTVSSRNLDQNEKPIHLLRLKDRSSARAESEEDQRAYSEVAYAVGYDNAEWLRDKRGFDYARAYALWGDELENLWKAAVRYESRKPKDKAIFRFQDACEGKLDLEVKPESETVEEDSAPKIRFGDVVSHPVEGEFVADFQALYQDAWRCPEGHFIPAEELRVVRSTDA